ncbi:hypothetical protein Tco_0031281 [Tanacetum coccineum]
MGVDKFSVGRWGNQSERFSKSELNLRTFSVMNAIDGSGGVEEVSQDCFVSGLKEYHSYSASSISHESMVLLAMRIDMIIKKFGLESQMSMAMMRVFGDIITEFCGPSRWKELSKESDSAFFPYCHREGKWSPPKFKIILGVGLDPRSEVVELEHLRFAPKADGVGSKMYHSLIPTGELDGLILCLMVWLE